MAVLGCNENVIEWLRDEERATVTFTQGRMKTRIKKLAEERPNECRILAENADGSIVAHIPTKWIRVSPPKQVSEEQREKARERFNSFHSNRGATLDEME